MKKVLICGVTSLVLLLVAGPACQSAEQNKERAAGVAGSFYPADPADLAAYVDAALVHADVPKVDGEIVGVVAPHAGYGYSGSIAAHSYAAIKGRKYKRVVLIGPSHFEAFPYTSVYDGDAYTTPLGRVAVDREFARKLAAADRSIKLSGTGHVNQPQPEHSLEVQLPFLQRALGDFTLVPIVMGDRSYQSSRALGMALAKLLRNDHDTLLVASSDLSHYHTYDEAVHKDRNLLNGITQNDFLTVSRNVELNVWEACGGGPIVAVMIASQHLGADSARLLKYANSGDVTGDKSRVVGYAALVFVKGPVGTKSEPLSLGEADRKELLKIARLSVEAAVRDHKVYEPPVPSSENLLLERGAFVTLKKNGELRGCIGYTSPIYPLYMTVRDVAELAAVRDPRFRPVRPEELNQLEYEVSVLSPFQHVLDTKAIHVGEHGLLVRNDDRDGILLPQVPVEEKWDRGTFLEQASMKAGLRSDAWQDEGTDLFTFTAIVFSDHEIISKKAKHAGAR